MFTKYGPYYFSGTHVQLQNALVARDEFCRRVGFLQLAVYTIKI